MRQDKSDALRERLRRGAQKFEFDALLQGVSTVEDEAGTQEQQEPTAAAGVPEAVPTPEVALPADLDGADRARLRAALDTLSQRLLQEAGKLRAALHAYDPQAGGYYLARVNEVLDLLHSVDPGGETARRLGVAVAPPVGRIWPTPCWTLYEFAESPLSGLLPAEADDEFLAEVVATAIEVPES